MSVLFKPQYNYEKQETSLIYNSRRAGDKHKRTDESLLVFGYSCNVYCDDEKAVYFDEGKHLIPWMGDESLMIDRFDGRLLLEDISPFVSQKPESGRQLTYEEQEIERLCDEERYQALNNEDHSEDEEEEMKRFKAAIASDGGSYSEVGMNYDEQYYPAQYTYDSTQFLGHMHMYNYPIYSDEQTISRSAIQEQSSMTPLLQQHTQMQQQLQEEQLEPQQILSEQQPPQEIELFVPPKELDIPNNMELPDTAKLHTIIERTAFFIKDHGPQMEIVVKAKQSGNPQFDFLQFDHRLNPYYKLILKGVRNGTYEPAKPATPAVQEEEEESDEDSDGEMELHPLLTASLRTPIVKKTQDIPPLEPPPLPPGWTAVNPDATPGSTSFTVKADNFLAGMDMLGQRISHPSEYPGNQHHVPTPPVYYANPTYPETSLADPMLPYLGAQDMCGAPIIPPPPDLKPICDKLAAYVARNGKKFEENIRKKNDPRFDFVNETSDHYTYYQMKIREFELNPAESRTESNDRAKSGILEPSSKPVSFQIKTKTNKGAVMEYKSSILYKTAKADESDDEETESNNTDSQNNKDVPQNDSETEPAKPDVHGPKTEDVVIAEERASKLKQEKEMEVQRLEEEVKSTTSSLKRQVQLERRRRAQLFINMLKKAKPGSATEQSTGNQANSNSSEPSDPS